MIQCAIGNGHIDGHIIPIVRLAWWASSWVAFCISKYLPCTINNHGWKISSQTYCTGQLGRNAIPKARGSADHHSSRVAGSGKRGHPTNICHRFYPQSCTCYMRSHLFHRHQFAIHLIGITMLLMHIILLHVFPPWLVYCLSSFEPFNPTRTHSGLKLLLLDSDETQNLMNYRLGFQKFKMFLAH